MSGKRHNPPRILVSRCLLGEPVRYDGASKPLSHPLLRKWEEQGLLMPVCPELLGGLAVPRKPAEIVGGDGADVLAGHARVLTIDGEDVTAAFIEGARRARDLAEREGCAFAVLKENSPSCGTHRIADGTFSGERKPGQGVTAALLRAAGLHVFNEKQLHDLAQALHEATSETPS